MWGGVYGGSEAFTKLKAGVTVSQANNALAKVVKMNYKERDAKVWFFKVQPL
jgi:putative ABC transport system permease protein